MSRASCAPTVCPGAWAGIYRRLALTPLTRQHWSQSIMQLISNYCADMLLVAIGGWLSKLTHATRLFWRLSWTLCFMSIGFALTAWLNLTQRYPIIQITYFAWCSAHLFPIALTNGWKTPPAYYIYSNGDAWEQCLIMAPVWDIWQKLAIMGVDRCLHGDFDTVFSVGIIHP